MGKFENGHKKYEGQGKRGPSKFTNLKQAFLDAFDGMGGIESLMEWGKKDKNKRHFYGMIAKMLPRNIKTDLDITASKGITFKVEDADGKPDKPK